MDRRGLSENDAYAMLRKRAMDQKTKVAEIARQLLAVANLLDMARCSRYEFA